MDVFPDFNNFYLREKGAIHIIAVTKLVTVFI